MTQNLPKMSNLIGFIDSRSKNLLWLEKSVKKYDFTQIWQFFAIFCDFTFFAKALSKIMFEGWNSPKLLSRGGQKTLSAIFLIFWVFSPYIGILRPKYPDFGQIWGISALKSQYLKKN